MSVRQNSLFPNRFDFFRLALASLVIWSHSFVLSTGQVSSEPLLRWTRGQIDWGGLAVDFFFVISGFLITYSWMRSASARDYLVKRVSRIYPGFILASLVQALLILPMVTPVFRGFTLRQWLMLPANILDLVGFGYPYGNVPPVFVHNPLPNVMNGSLWTIRYEFVCYLLIPVLASLGFLRRRWPLAAVWAGIVVMTGLGVVIPTHKLVTATLGAPLHWPRFLSFFLAGMVFCVYREQISWRRSYALVCVAALVIAARLPPVLTYLLPVCGGYALLCFALPPARVFTEFGRFGDFSYGTYLYAFPIQQCIVMAAGGRIGPVRLFLIACPLSIAAGIASWFVVERWFLRRKRRHGSAGHPPQSPAPAMPDRQGQLAASPV